MAERVKLKADPPVRFATGVFAYEGTIKGKPEPNGDVVVQIWRLRGTDGAWRRLDTPVLFIREQKELVDGVWNDAHQDWDFPERLR